MTPDSVSYLTLMVSVLVALVVGWFAHTLWRQGAEGTLYEQGYRACQTEFERNNVAYRATRDAQIRRDIFREAAIEARHIADRLVKRSIPANAIIRYLAESGGVFNLKNFGATGDGITDDTAAIQAATDAATPAPDGAA